MIGVAAAAANVQSCWILPFIILDGADLEEWTNHSSILTYADDTSTSCHGKSQEEVIVKLEEDSKNILQFLASNGLV